jgi:DnaJ-domain-containing protein 1
VGVLETDIKDLKQMMTGQLQEMENKSQKFREDQFKQLVTLLKQERQQKEELLRQVTRLEMDNKTLKRVGRMLKEKLLGKSLPSLQK